MRICIVYDCLFPYTGSAGASRGCESDRSGRTAAN